MPEKKWLDLAKKTKTDIEEVAQIGRAERNRKIDRKARVWGTLKPWLLTLSHRKCWFSEARECFENWEVEHFRPKKKALDVDGSERDGYWWLSFEWTNYRVCGRRLNATKGTYFPVINSPTEEVDGTLFPVHNFPADDTHRNQVDDELPFLLDPCVEDDCELLSFNELGKAVPMSGAEGWNLERVQVSIKHYMLDFEGLELARALVWETCQVKLNQIQNLMKEYCDNPSATKKALIQEKKKQLEEMADEENEFSSIALAFLLKSEYEWVRSLAARQKHRKLVSVV
jgi:hypothetical protein